MNMINGNIQKYTTGIEEGITSLDKYKEIYQGHKVYS
jgi:hypothetical protein